MPPVTRLNETTRRQPVDLDPRNDAVNAPSRRGRVAEVPVDADNGLARVAPRAGSGARGEAAGGVAMQGDVSLTRETITAGGEKITLTALPGASASEALLRAARAACDAEENPFEGAKPEARKSVANRLQAYLANDKRAKRPSAAAIELRSASSALLARLVPAMKTKAERAEQREAISSLLSAAEAEPHPQLRRAMIANLTSIPDRLLLAKEKGRRDELLGEVLHEAAPRDKWFGDDPHPTMNVSVSVMDEFYRGELRAYRDNGYQIVEHDAEHSTATKKVIDDRGRDVTIKIALRKNDSEVFDPAAEKDTHVVLYTGHAQLGGVTKISLENGPRSDNGSKLIGLFACRGKQNLPQLTKTFPESHVLVSDRGTYAHDDRIVIHRLLEGAATGKSYEQIERGALREGLWEKDNYVFPHEVAHLRLDDITGAGKLFGNGLLAPVVFEPSLEKVRGRATSMRPMQNPPEPGGLAGDNVVNAVNFFSTVHGYYAESNGNRAEKRLQDRITADGWFASDNRDEIVRLEDARGADGKPVIKVKVNAAYSNQSTDALAMMVLFDLGMRIGERTRPDEDLGERRLRSLAMVGSYVYYLVEYSDVADDLLKKFADRFNFPPTLSWPVVQRATDSDPHGDCSPKVLRAFARGMQHPFLEVNPNRSDPEFRNYIGRALDRLRDSGTAIGRMTYEAIVTGKVLVDELADLTLEDFKRAHRDFAKEGIELPMEDAMRLHDGRVTSIRTLQGAIDGYEWDNRVYVARGLDPDHLAETLVHEVNHVLNESEENYRSSKAIFLEEYRARYAEALFRGDRLDAKACKKLKERVIEEYGLRGVTPEDLPDRPPGRLVE